NNGFFLCIRGNQNELHRRAEELSSDCRDSGGSWSAHKIVLVLHHNQPFQLLLFPPHLRPSSDASGSVRDGPQGWCNPDPPRPPRCRQPPWCTTHPQTPTTPNPRQPAQPPAASPFQHLLHCHGQHGGWRCVWLISRRQPRR